MDAIEQGSKLGAPELAQATMSDVYLALRRGVRDFRRSPVFGLIFAGVYVAVGWLMWAITAMTGQTYWLVLAVISFPLVGSFAAVGLYETSRRLEFRLAMDWHPSFDTGGDQQVLVLPTGPADTWETCTLFFLNSINNARTRIWIASPYFVPDFQIMNALQLAALRGVDVRILIPEKTDNRLIRLAAYSYLVQASQAGIGIYRYQPGFMHQKVVLVDDRYAAVGTANLDNRSMRLNFEITAVNTNGDFVRSVDTMLREDLEYCQRMTERDYQDRSILFRLSCRAVRLLAPLL